MAYIPVSMTGVMLRVQRVVMPSGAESATLLRDGVVVGPADRFLAATAKVLKLTLVTADQRLLGLGEIASLANR